MSIEAENVALLRDLPEPTSADIHNARNLFAEDFKWHYFNEGFADLNKTYHGFDGWMQFFKDLAEKTGGTFSVGKKDVFAIGPELVVVHALPNMVIDGLSLETDAVVVWRIVDGKIAEAWDIPGLNSAIRPRAPVAD